MGADKKRGKKVGEGDEERGINYYQTDNSWEVAIAPNEGKLSLSEGMTK